MSDFDLKAEREWLDAHPTVTAVNVNAYVAALNEIARLAPVYEAAKAIQMHGGVAIRFEYKRVDTLCRAVETAEAVVRG